jgi:magnesium chelatase family protein
VIVGLPDAAVKESRDRVMTALINSGFNFTFGRTTINLALADVKEEGPSFDLPIALRARAEGKVGVLVPPENAAEAAVVAGLQVIPIHNLREAISFLEGRTTITPTTVDIAALFQHRDDEEMDFAEVKGQESVKGAMEIAAAGRYKLLMLWSHYPAFIWAANARLA